MKLNIIFLIFLVPHIHAQLNPEDAPRSTWSPQGLTEWEQIVSTINTDAVCTDTKNWDLLSLVFTQDAIGSYGAGSNLSYGIEAIKAAHVGGTNGFITQHLLSNFLITIADDCQTANATYYAADTLFTDPQETGGQWVKLVGYYNDQLVKTADGWRIKYLEYRFIGPGWSGNLSVLGPDYHPTPPSSYEPPTGRRMLL